MSPDSPKRRYGDNRPTARDIRVIHGGFKSSGCSSSSKKRHAKSAHGRTEEEIYNLSLPFVDVHTPITFNNDDLRGLHLPHDDALVVSAIIANFNVQRILVDNGSSAKIIFISAFDKMKIRMDKLHPFHTPLVKFGGSMTHPLGWIKLLVTLGTEPHQNTIWQDFILVDCPSPYNAILSRPTLGGIKAITSTYHLKNEVPHFYRSGCGVGLMLQTPSGEQMEYAIRIGFKATNNKAEYEALLTGLRVVAELGVDSLDVFSNSQLVVNQVQGDCLTKDTRMVAYLDEIGVPSFRTSNFNVENNEAKLRLNLDLLDEKRENAEISQVAYKHPITKYYNQKVKHKSFLSGYLVLRKVSLSTKEPNVGKLGPTWEGPYRVIKVSRPGTYWLKDTSGKALPYPWNTEHLKKYYQ
ncbi:hypothetical protein Acr_08g0011400 [Actinidia rufa]|uniref:RNase H type-1 domain-containing protein n=1 Tax=Actinidia rufa TaxID=165716 RepID=A0A7J0F238_9ERIC|nr:hypothetical protein Acr_08g0011400 [Actinidia rufa]